MMRRRKEEGKCVGEKIWPRGRELRYWWGSHCQDIVRILVYEFRGWEEQEEEMIMGGETKLEGEEIEVVMEQQCRKERPMRV